MKSKSYFSLSFLRIVFIFLIFLEHYPITPLRVGGKAVCFFFVLSGFVLSYGYGNKLSIEGITYKNFLMPRFVKLYPLHWLLLSVGIWIGRDFLEQTCYYLPANLLLLQSWIPTSDSYFSGNGISWFLSTTLFLYLVFPCLWNFCSRQTLKRNLFIYVILTVVRCILEFVISGDAKIDWLYINPATRWMDFTVGIITFLMYKRLQENFSTNKLFWQIFAFLSVMLTLGTFYVTHNVKYPLALFWIAYSCLICGSVMVESVCGENFQQRHLRLIRVINELGNISFSFYLLHQIVIMVLFNHKPLNLLDNNIIKFFIILIVCTFLAYISHHYFERPVSQRLKNIIIKKDN